MKHPGDGAELFSLLRVLTAVVVLFFLSVGCP
jgi:hypothetical protein